MLQELVYLENFFSNFDTNLTDIESNLNKQSERTLLKIDHHLSSKQVEFKLNESRDKLIHNLNNQFRVQFDNLKKVIWCELTKFLYNIKDSSFEYNDFKLILFKLKCKLFDYGLLNSHKGNILSESIIDFFYDEANSIKLDELLYLIDKLFSNLKVLFKKSDLNWNVTYIGDVVIENDLINLAKCDYFDFYNTFDDVRLASETLARNNHLNYKLLSLTPYQIFIYPKTFNQTTQIKIIDSNGKELFRKLKDNLIELVPYHFILTSKYLIAVFYNSETLKYSCDLYDLRLNLIRSKQLKRLINVIEINKESIDLKSIMIRTNELIDGFLIYNNELKVENQHLKNRILFSYNYTYQGYIIKVKSNDYLFKKIISSHLQVANKTLVLAYSTQQKTTSSCNCKNILLEFTSYDKKYYDFTSSIE